MFQTKVVVQIKTRIMCSITFFEKKKCLFEITWKNAVERRRAQMTIRLKRVACLITKFADTLRICNTYCFSAATMVARTGLIVTFYVHWLSCSFLIFATGPTGSLFLREVSSRAKRKHPEECSTRWIHRGLAPPIVPLPVRWVDGSCAGYGSGLIISSLITHAVNLNKLQHIINSDKKGTINNK
jgi:hypothetical protein